MGIVILITKLWYFCDEHQKVVRKRAECKWKVQEQLPGSKKQHVGQVQYLVLPVEQGRDGDSDEDLDEDAEMMEPSGVNQVLSSTHDA